MDPETDKLPKKNLFDDAMVSESFPNVPTIFTHIEIKKGPKTQKIFRLRSFFPDISEVDLFDNAEKKLIDQLKFGPDDIEKFLSYDQKLIKTFQNEFNALTTLLFRDEFSKSRQLIVRLLEILESKEKKSFLFFKSSPNSKKLTLEIQTILDSLQQYESKIVHSRSELNHYLARFETLKNELVRYKKITTFLLEKGNYEILDSPEQIKAILLNKIANMEDRLRQIDSGSELHTLRNYLIHFSLVVENIIIQNGSYLIDLANDALHSPNGNKEHLITTLKGFLNG
ncbi:MAG: hypothetical protein AB7S65_07280 [Sulfuricurvum sp.]